MKFENKLLGANFLLCLLFFLIIFSPLQAQESLIRNDDGSIILENFEKDPVGGFPLRWYDRDGNKKLVNHSEEFTKNYLYEVVNNDDNKFLRYEGTAAKHISLPLINEEKENIYDLNIYNTPILSWKVRAHSLPKNANEKSGDHNDSVASIYVVFDMGRIALFKRVPKTIRYTWSTTLPKGETTSKLFGNQQIIVVKSGSQDTGKWVTFERNLVEDYRQMFGDAPPKNPLAILILSDGNSTGSYVKADFDDIILKPLK